MKGPICPSCENKITLTQGFKMTNPKKMRCPHCNVGLEYAGAWGTVTVLGPVLGLGVAGFAIFMEQTDRWSMTNSIVFFIAVFGTLMIIGLLLWPYTKFQVKDEQ